MLLMDSDCRSGEHCLHTISYNLSTFCFDLIFLFQNAFFSLFNKLVRDYFHYVINALALVKPYLFMNFVNLDNGMIGIYPVLINVNISSGCLKFASTWVMNNSLN